MKRIVKLLTLVLALAALLAVSAFAADFTHCAEALDELGLFQGTDSGYDLDRAPTRAEAAAMLVRLLGAEDEAQAAEAYTAPFTDVRAWAQPYVQYLYDNGLTNGVSETAFGASDPCTARQYATFLLRALGYSDGENGDFTWETALDFARELGVVNDYNCDESNFLRDDVVAMSYTALATAPKTGEADLLTKLVDEGAITGDAASIQERFAAYRDYTAASAAGSEETSASMRMDMNMDIAMDGQTYMTADVGMDLAMILDEAHMDQTRMAYAMEMALATGDGGEPTTETMNVYYSDGVMYMDTSAGKLSMPFSFEEILAQMPAEALETQAAVEPLCLFDDIARAEADGVVTYRLDYAVAPFNSLFTQVLSAMSADLPAPMEMDLSRMTVQVQLADGELSAMQMEMQMAVSDGTTSMDMTADVEITDIVVGDAVTVSLPDDLDTYVDVSAGTIGVIGGADGPTSIVVGEVA